MKITDKTPRTNCGPGFWPARKWTAAAVVLLAANAVWAQTSGVWTNKANGNWSAAVNWQGGHVASGADAVADFATITWTNGHQTTLDGPYTVGTVKFGNYSNAGNTNYLIGSAVLTLQTSAGNPTLNASNQMAVVGVPLVSGQQISVLGNAVAITNAANATGVTGGWMIQAGQAGFMGAAAVGNGPLTLGTNAGAGQLGFNLIDPAAAGTVPITLPNDVTVQTVRWIVGQNGCTLGAQPVILNGNVTLNSGLTGLRDIYPLQPLTLNGQVTGGGNYGIQLNGVAALTLANPGNMFSGNITFTAGNTLGVNSDGALGIPNNKISMNTSGNTLRIDASFTTTRSIVLGTSTCNINVQTNVLEVDSPYGAAISGSGGLVVQGSTNGELLLTGPNSYTGSTTVNSSGLVPAATTLALTGGASIGSATVSVNSNALFTATDSSALPNLLNLNIANGAKAVLSSGVSWNSAANFTLSGGSATLDISSLSSSFAVNGTLAGGGVVNGAVTMNSGSTLIPGTVGTAAVLNIANSLNLSGQTIQFDVTNVVTEGSGLNDEIVVGGDLVLAGGEKILLNYTGGSLAAGVYKLFKFGGALHGAFALVSPYPNVTIDNGVGTPGYVTLVVGPGGSAGSSLFWQGDGVANVWDEGSSQNWVANYGGSPFAYTDPDKVTFDDFGAANVPVTLNTVVYPNTVVFNVTNKAYTLAGSGKISGLTSVTINGSNAVTNGLANNYSGTTYINGAGKLVLLDGSAIGTGPVTFGSASAQVIAQNTGALTIPNRLNGNSYSAQIVQAGPGTTTLANTSDNPYLVGIVNNGTLKLGAASSSTVHAIGGSVTINPGGTLKLGGTGGDQIYSSDVVYMRGGTFDTAGLNEGFATLDGFGSIIGGGSLTNSGGISLNTSGTLAVTNTIITVQAAGQSSAGGIYNPGSFILEGGTLIMPNNLWFGYGASGLQTVVLDGTVQGSGGQCIWGEDADSTVTTFGPNANCTFWFISYSATRSVTNWYNGGRISFARFNMRNTGTGTVEHHFNGTVFTARQNDATFFGGDPRVFFYVSTNGFILNDAGYNLTIPVGLSHDYVLGGTVDGGLTKSGSGTLTLAGTNTFSGSLTVNGGSVALNNLGSYHNVVLGDNAALTLNIISAGHSLTNDSLTLGASGGTDTLTFNLGALGLPTTPIMYINGAVANADNVTVNISSAAMLPGSIPLFKYGSMDADKFTATWTVSPIPYVTLTLTNDTVSKVVSVVVEPGTTPKWRGNLSSAWDTTTLNWITNTTPVAYKETTPPGQPVQFDDSALNFVVDISSATVDPLFITMTNSTTYTFSGSLGIGGTSSLIKSGAGSLVFSNANNTYSGVTLVTNGSLVAAVPNVLSPKSTMTFGNATLAVGTNAEAITNATFNNSFLTGTGPVSGGTLTFNNGAANFTLPALAGSISVNQNGTGTISLTNANTFTGAVNVNSGIVRVTDIGALGSGAFSDGQGTVVAMGAALVFDGANGGCTEYIHMSGAGPTGDGALIVTNGQIGINQHFGIVDNTTLNIGANAALTNSGEFFFAGGTILTKIGAGLLYASSLNQVGLVANAGTTIVTGSVGGGANGQNVVVNSGATFGGSATISRSVIVNAGATLAPGNFKIGTMTIGDSLTNSGAVLMEVSYDGTSTNADNLNVATNLVLGGTLTVANIGSSPLAAGQVFQLLTAPSYAQVAFTSVTLPTLPTGLGWTNRLAIDGTIAVVAAVSTTPFSIATSVTGNQLTLSWPQDHTGWRLQVQTNALSAGLGAGWVDVPDATATNQFIFPVDANNGSVFYRMVYP